MPGPSSDRRGIGFVAAQRERLDPFKAHRVAQERSMALAGNRDPFEMMMACSHFRHCFSAEDVGVFAADRQHRYAAQTFELRPQDRYGGLKVDILDRVTSFGSKSGRICPSFSTKIALVKVRQSSSSSAGKCAELMR